MGADGPGPCDGGLAGAVCVEGAACAAVVGVVSAGAGADGAGADGVGAGAESSPPPELDEPPPFDWSDIA